MPTTEKLRSKLLKKLTELFQLDQPDLDFGFYRIMHAKAEQISSFIDKDLLQIIENAFGQVDEGRKAELQQKITREIDAAREYGVPDPENSPKVMEARAKYDALKDGATAEADVYDHLYRFFERYYDEGDFISRRYYARENGGKAAPFAIPYNGEEVKLHWANADQYYIKTAEYFSNFTFDLAQSAEVRALQPVEREALGLTADSLKVHFRIVDADEGEHGNVKASDDKKRFFVLYEANPVELNEAVELVINFEYKSLPSGKNDVDNDTEKALKDLYGKSINKGDLPNLFIGKAVLDALNTLEGGKAYKNLLALKAPTDKIADRPLLVKYVNQYTARNTCDYFIHKDLEGFFKRELDFYIKNEVMHLDDIENADAPAVESYLAKIKVIRKIAGKLIEFLAQLEEFQKKLWLKKKFVTETNYCITLDRVPEELYKEIALSDAQREEWVKLFAIDEITATDGDLLGVGAPDYSVPLTEEFLKANNKLVLDTAFFSDEFKVRLIESIDDFDEQCDGLLIHSENFQALNLLQERYREQVKCVYIDPPYNTDASAILYKNNYKHSSFHTLMENRLQLAPALQKKDGIIAIAIDDEEVNGLRSIANQKYAKQIGITVVRSNPAGRKTKGKLAPAHEYALFYGVSPDAIPNSLEITEKRLSRYPHSDEAGNYAWANFIRSGTNDKRHDRPKMFYPIAVSNDDSFRIPKIIWNSRAGQYDILESISETETLVYPITKDGVEKRWQRGFERFSKELEQYKVTRGPDKKIDIHFKTYMDESSMPVTWWDKKEYASANYGAAELKELFKENPFDFPKSRELVKDCLRVAGMGLDSSIVLDFFGGSGTTADAIVSLNKNNEVNNKFVVIEMGDHFNDIIKPRITKVIYSSDWKEGKPTSRNTGISHCFKYLRLESYEDTLNNLEFDKIPARDKIMEQNGSLREDYMLHYLLDVETRGSQSLLNIDSFANPTAYTLKVKKPGSDEQTTKTVDLVESFNYLLGLRLINMAAPQSFTASFTRKPDPELPEDQHTKLVLDGKLTPVTSGKWWFRKLEGWVPADPMNPNNGQKEKVLIVWRNLTGNLEEDNLMLDEWFKKFRLSTTDFEFDTIYVNGSNNLPNLKKDDENWKVRLIEEEFHKKMWEA